VRRVLLLMVPTVVVGLAAAFVTIAVRQGDPAFVYEQQHPAAIAPGQLEEILVRTHEPVPSGPGSAATSASCFPGQSGPKRNPWHCMLRYRSGQSLSYRILVQSSGRFEGVDRSGTGVIHGCCLKGDVVPSSSSAQ
jgi:hypothetical protein